MTELKLETMPFKGWITKKTKGQEFGKPKIKKYGKEVDVYSWIQEGREDTEIYETIEKYGCIDRMKLDTQGIYDDFTEIKDLRNFCEQNIKAQELWESLPLETRQEFNHDKTLFAEKGEEWLLNKIAAEKQTKPGETTDGAQNVKPE